MASLPVKKYNTPVSALPASWDARTAWPACSTTISHVRDQSACGSCWAFGSTEAFNDRACIFHNVTKEYSASDTNSCCNMNNGCSSMGCDGGYPSDAWNYFVNTGLVTGGDYDTVNTGATCFPYPLPTCSHHEQGKYPMCPTNEYNTPACPTACTDPKYPTAWAQDLSFAKSAYSVNSVTDIMTELVNNGPVTAAFDVYEDFLTYKSGVYKYTTGQLLGGHAVEIIGYGTDPSAGPYWVVKNSWNQYWGNGGYFLIAKGVDECGIEDGIVAGAV
jgi:cathepsin B